MADWQLERDIRRLIRLHGLRSVEFTVTEDVVYASALPAHYSAVVGARRAAALASTPISVAEAEEIGRRVADEPVASATAKSFAGAAHALGAELARGSA